MFKKLLLASALLAPMAAAAQPVRGLYVDFGAGANLAGDLTASGLTQINTSLGPVGLVAVG